jgi:hypothetical protein
LRGDFIRRVQSLAREREPTKVPDRAEWERAQQHYFNAAERLARAHGGNVAVNLERLTKQSVAAIAVGAPALGLNDQDRKDLADFIVATQDLRLSAAGVLQQLLLQAQQRNNSLVPYTARDEVFARRYCAFVKSLRFIPDRDGVLRPLTDALPMVEAKLKLAP